jgi:hypothetical protein
MNSVDGSTSNPVLAETLGGLFRCYAPKVAPKLPPSTELTNHLARLKFAVNVRGEATRSKRSAGSQQDESMLAEGKDEDEEDEDDEDSE